MLQPHAAIQRFLAEDVRIIDVVGHILIEHLPKRCFTQMPSTNGGGSDRSDLRCLASRREKDLRAIDGTAIVDLVL
jgi:hypothetical protein